LIVGHSKDEWNSGPKLDEARVLAPEVPGHRARKDRRRWCRGKVGIEHVTALVMSKWAVHFRARPDADQYPQHWRCGWFEKGRWCHVEGQRLREFVGNGEWYYSCKHVHTCTSCGKILGNATSRECPEYAPRR
jgi:hypothetical protein